MNVYDVEKLLKVIGALRLSDVEKFVEERGLDLDAEEIYVIISKLYDTLYNC